MKDTLIIVGSIVVALLLMGMPIIMVISFIYDWGAFIKYVSVMLSVIEWLVLSMLIGQDAINER